MKVQANKKRKNRKGISVPTEKFHPPLNLEMFGNTPGKMTVLCLSAVTSKLRKESALELASE